MASVPVVEPEVSVVPISSAPPVPDSLKITCLEHPYTLECADDCPVIVWGDFTYWPLSYLDNRVAMCLVAYDLSNNVANKWELPGARYVVTVTVNSSRREFTLLGQSSSTVTVSWNEIGKVVPRNPQYFWIINGASHAACRAAANTLALGRRAVDDDQLWLVDGGRQAIFPKSRNLGMCLDYHESPDATPVLLTETNWGRPQQRWIIDNGTGNFKPAAGTLLATVSALNSVELQVPSATANQSWYLTPYLPSPDLSIDQLSLLMPGESFMLSNQNQMLASSGSGPLTLVPEANSSVLWSCNGGGALVSAQDGLAITASNDSSVMASPWTAGHIYPEQQWCLTTNGFLVCRANGLLMVGRGNTVVLSSYDALGPADQIWLVRFQQAEASSGVVRKRSVKSTASRDNITQLTVTAQVANDFWAGTSDRIYVRIGNKQSVQVLFDSPARNDKVTIAIDLNLMFGKPAINLFEDVVFMSLAQEAGIHPIASDAWKLASIILKAKDQANNEFTNYTFQKVDQWLDNQQSGMKWVWSSPIPWGAWLDASRQPIDLNGATYPVGWIPYIGDIKSWREYNPSGIDGVGQLLGMRDGRLIGELLKPQQTEVLQPTDENHSYTWVFTPNGAIIYKLWNKQDTSHYIRHSQLGSGDPVICAGEMQMNKIVQNNYIVTDVIAMVNDASGHYKPDGGACLRYVGQKLQELGIPTDDINWYSR